MVFNWNCPITTVYVVLHLFQSIFNHNWHIVLDFLYFIEIYKSQFIIQILFSHNISNFSQFIYFTVLEHSTEMLEPTLYSAYCSCIVHVLYCTCGVSTEQVSYFCKARLYSMTSRINLENIINISGHNLKLKTQM